MKSRSSSVRVLRLKTMVEYMVFPKTRTQAGLVWGLRSAKILWAMSLGRPSWGLALAVGSVMFCVCCMLAWFV